MARATKIRPRYLEALEAGRLSELPGRVYARGFVRDYAHFLGIDPEPLLERLAPGDADEDESALSPLALAGLGPPPRRRVPVPTLAAASAVLLLAVVAIAWPRGGSGSGGVPLTTPPAAGAPTPKAATPVPAPPRPRSLAVTLLARRGSCWVEARRGSAAGSVALEETVRAGGSLALGRTPLYLRLGAPWNVDLRVGGHVRALQTAGEPVDLLVTAAGVRAVR